MKPMNNISPILGDEFDGYNWTTSTTLSSNDKKKKLSTAAAGMTRLIKTLVREITHTVVIIIISILYGNV